MAKLPGFIFYPGDWLRDSVSGCSLEAQGLWLRMMIIGHDSDRYGYLASNGVAIPAGSIAQRCGCTLPQYTTLLAELTAAGVPSRTPEGIIYSRRMVKDAQKREQGAERQRNFKKRKKEGNASVTQKKRSGNAFYEYEIESVFEVLWSKYPNKEKKQLAKKAFTASVKSPEDLKLAPTALDNYLAAVEIDRKSNFARRYQNGDTWFRNWREWLEWKEPESKLSQPRLVL